MTSSAPRHALKCRTRSFASSPDMSTAAGLLLELTAAERPVLADIASPLVLYGAGNLGRLAYSYFKAVGIPVQAVVDREADTLRADADWSGIALYTPKDTPSDLKQTAQLAVCVATAPFAPLAASLQDDGWTFIVPFYDLTENLRDMHPLGNGWIAPPQSSEDFAATSEVLRTWADDASRAHHLQFLAWHIGREEWSFADAPVRGNDRFFISPVAASLGTDAVLLDGGAHYGSVTTEFIRRTKGQFAAVIAVEPDAPNRAVLAGAIDKLSPELAARIVVHPVALDSESCTRKFCDGYGYASRLGSNGKCRLQTRTIDSLGLSPSLIKLHLEGGELNALRGATETMTTHRPIVMATTYHNSDGIWKIPHFLMATLKNYRYLMRAHSWCGTGAVVYAIPAERWQ